MADIIGGLSFYRGAPQEEALARLSYAVENRLRVAALTGRSGVGKSTLLAEFARHQRKAGASVALLGGFEPRQMLGSIAAQWGLFPERNAEHFTLWQDITDRLVQLRCENRPGVLLIDPLEGDPQVLRLLRQLVAGDPHPESRLTLVLALEPRALGDLPGSFRELIDLHVELEAWDETDVRAAVAEERFTPDGLEELQALTLGVARQVVRLTRFASLAATVEQLGSIDSETLIAVQDNLLPS